MSTEPAEPSRAAAPAARRGGEPRSTLWRVAVGTTPVVATALTLEFGRTLVVDSFGETEVVETLASTLRAFWVLLVIGGLLFAGYRWYSRRLDGERLERTLAVLDTLDEPDGAVVGIPVRPEPTRPEPEAALRDPAAAVLRELPVLRYDAAMLLAVAAALVDNAESPAEQGTPPSTIRSATDLRDRLVRDAILTAPTALRYDLARVPKTPLRADVLKTPAWAAALYALVREYADRASARAVALGHPGQAAKARRWFDTAEPELHALVVDCSRAGTRDHLPTAVLPELVRIVDALDLVYDENDSRRVALCRRVGALPGMTAFPLHRDLLRLRANPASGNATRYRPLTWSTGVAARSSHNRALRHLRSESELDDAAIELGRTWRLLPQADLHAQVCVLINLAVVELRRGNLDAAADRLDLALARTENGRDPAGRVHATEISGILHWMRGATPVALRDWLTAHTGYNALDDHRGAARCLRHLGAVLADGSEFSGVAIAPIFGSVLLHSEVVAVARYWRADADRLDRDGSAAVLSVRRPRELDDPHLRIPRPTTDR